MKINCRLSFELQISFTYDFALRNLQFEEIVTKNFQKKNTKKEKGIRMYNKDYTVNYQIEMHNKNLSCVYDHGRENTKTLFELIIEHPY